MSAALAVAAVAAELVVAAAGAGSCLLPWDAVAQAAAVAQALTPAQALPQPRKAATDEPASKACLLANRLEAQTAAEPQVPC